MASGPARLNAFLRMRRSVREFKPDPVPREVLEGVLDAARYAPTASNRQDLGWIVVQDRPPCVAWRTALPPG